MNRQHGATLIELMVALVVGMLVAIAVFSIMAVAEGRRRATTTVNSLNGDGLVAVSQIEHWVRSVGGGLSAGAAFVYGCKLNASKDGKAILPLPAALPAPFDGFDASTPMRVAPLIIWPAATTPGDSGLGSDALVVMTSGTGGGGLPVAFAASPDTRTIYPKHHSLDAAGQDLLLVAEGQSSGTAAAGCTITQVQQSFTRSTNKSLPLDGPYAVDLSGFSSDAAMINLGNMPGPTSALPAGAEGGRPQFLMIGVGDHSTLFSYDLLQGGASKAGDERPVPVAGGVLEMHALYGIGVKGDGKVDTWVKPEGDYAPATLLDGSVASLKRLKNIKAVRVGIILRTTLPDRVEGENGQAPPKGAVITEQAPVLFGDLGALSYTRAWGQGSLKAEQEKLYRYRTLEVVMPLRNAVMVDSP